jgi:hypothetical protein
LEYSLDQMKPALYFIEHLTLRAWVFNLWPRLFWSRIRQENRITRCYVIDGSGLSILIAKGTAWVIGTAVEKLAFSLVDVQDESGALIGLRILHQDMEEVQQYLMAGPEYQELDRLGILQDRLPIFLTKGITSATWNERSNTWRALLLVQLSAWKTKQMGSEGIPPILVLNRRPWISAITKYAHQNGVTVIPIRPPVSLQNILRRRVHPEIINTLRLLRYRWRQQGLLSSVQSLFKPKPAAPGNDPSSSSQQSGITAQDPPLRVAVEYYGQLNLNHPELHSDLFFWQKSSMPGRDILLTFAYPADPLDEQKWVELKQHGIGAAVLHPGATTLPHLPVFTHRPVRNQTLPEGVSTAPNGLEQAWLKEQIANYQTLRSYWTSLFEIYGVRVYVTWSKNGGTHCAIADALQSLGGVTAIYQRSYESHPSPLTTVGADIVFGFSPAVAEIERRSNSVIRYHVTTGYLGDHRFPLLKSNAPTVRDQLQQHGAKHILCYTDENSGDDSRWHTGHPFMQMNYAFLLEKLMTNPWLGLVIKPKTPQTLHLRLGPVAELLKEAEATGRCHVFEGGAIQGSYPPVAAGLAADVAIHGHLCAGTAGVELALAGTPTLLLDREGWPTSPLYQLGKGQVVFTDWEQLWEACTQHWATPGGIPGFGDWSSMLDELDPFRDGRAAERMGSYVQWLIEGFQSGLDRETIMADAAERYCAMWGRDKISEVNSACSSQNSSQSIVTGQTAR